MGHVVLLGDSVFDNARYVEGGPDVRSQLEAQLPPEWRVTLLAVDGHRTLDVVLQLKHVPADASHLVVSVGGNDALDHFDFLTGTARSVADALGRLAVIVEAFERQYHQMIRSILQHHLPTALCTIYYPRFPDQELQCLAVTALTVFNDSIIREAFRTGIPLLDLRLICNAGADYANPIEPSTAGGAKIAAAIGRLLHECDFTRGRTEAFVSP
jgi:GDSL-like Lipase/Acylhydrolase family